MTPKSRLCASCTRYCALAGVGPPALIAPADRCRAPCHRSRRSGGDTPGTGGRNRPGPATVSLYHSPPQAPGMPRVRFPPGRVPTAYATVSTPYGLNQLLRLPPWTAICCSVWPCQCPAPQHACALGAGLSGRCGRVVRSLPPLRPHPVYVTTRARLEASSGLSPMCP